MNREAPRNLLLGQLRREYLITAAGRALLDQPGGNLLYAAGASLLWLDAVGIVARVGEDYPREWLARFGEHGLNTAGVRILPEGIDLRTFRAFTDLDSFHTDDPVGHFARLEIPFPKSLLGYKDTSKQPDSKTKLTPLSLRQSDLPEQYHYASAAHLCPVDYLTHSLMPAVLRQVGLTTVTLDPGPSYMNTSFWDDVPALLPGLTAFLPSGQELRELFRGRSEDLWEMAEALAAYDCEVVVIKRGPKGQLLYDAASGTRHEVPAYPARVVDTTGAGDAFCGGFLAGYRRTYDPLQAVLHGNVAASIVIEGSGPFYTRDVLPGLQQARLETLPEMVRQV